MNGQEPTRRLTTIVAADVAGYSRLVAADEEGTLAALRQHRTELIDPKIAEYQGRIANTAGDSLLIEFPSVVEALRCAIDVQHGMIERNAGIPEQNRIEFRVGINLGDVVEQNGDLLGDGVNVAARLEGIAAPGGICLSRAARDQVRDRIEISLDDMGEIEVKNIPRPVRVFRVLPDRGAVAPPDRRISPWQSIVAILAALAIVIWGGSWWWQQQSDFEPADPDKFAFSLPVKPSIAVLPFDNISGDSTQDYFADGLSENIISALSKVPGMFVIARNSTFTYKGRPVKVQNVAEELGVRYVLEGGVQRSGERIRVSAQLVDAVKGHHLWSESYDRKLTELFAVQDDITLRIVSSLEVKLTEGEQARLRFGRGTRNIEAWASATRGFALFRTLSKQNNARARQLIEKATQLDPSFAWAWAVLAATHWGDARNGWSSSRAESLRKSFELANKSTALDDSVPYTYSLLGLLHLLKRDYEKAIVNCEKAVALDPNGADSKAILGVILTYAGRPREAATLLERAMRLNPRHPAWYLITVARSYRMSGRLDDAIEPLKIAKKRIPHNDHARVVLIVSYLELGKIDDAEDEAAALIEMNPKFSVRKFANVIPYKDAKQTERVLDALREVGLPE